MADFDQLKQKYQPVVDAINNNGGQVMNINLDGEQLYLKAEMDSEVGKDKVWDAIKAVDPTFADLKHDIEVKAGGQMYVVQAGIVFRRSPSTFTVMRRSTSGSPRRMTSTIPI